MGGARSARGALQSDVALGRIEEVAEGEPMGFDEDMYGAAMFSIIFDLRDMMTGGEDPISLSVFRFVFLLTVLVCNYLLQLGLLFWIYTFVVQPSMHQVQVIYARFHAECFDEAGSFRRERWEEFLGKPELCQVVYYKFEFIFAILFLWSLTVLNEFRKIERLIRVVFSVPELAPHEMHKMVRVQDDHEIKYLVVGVTKVVRAALVSALIIPKLFICLILGLLGMVWLTATESFSDLILNAVALEFVIFIDDTLFNALMPVSIKEKISAAAVWRPLGHSSVDEDPAAKFKSIYAGFQRSLAYFFASLMIVYTYLHYLQWVPFLGVMPGFQFDISEHCHTFLSEQMVPICGDGDGECFPFGVPYTGWFQE